VSSLRLLATWIEFEDTPADRVADIYHAIQTIVAVIDDCAGVGLVYDSTSADVVKALSEIYGETGLSYETWAQRRSS